jgi:hypothetical protein
MESESTFPIRLVCKQAIIRRHPILQCMDRHEVQVKQRCCAAHESVQAFWRNLSAAGEGLLQGLRVEPMQHLLVFGSFMHFLLISGTLRFQLSLQRAALRFGRFNVSHTLLCELPHTVVQCRVLQPQIILILHLPIVHLQGAIELF